MYIGTLLTKIKAPVSLQMRRYGGYVYYRIILPAQ